MVNPGGETTMLGHWRIALRQAEESARAGRLDEALALAGRPDVADHRQAVQLRAKLVLELVGRAGRRASADDLPGAIGDLKLAERHGVAPDVLAAARLKLAEQVADEVKHELEAGDPARVVERVEALARDGVGGPALRRYREAAEAWQQGLAEGRRGEFGLAREALDRAERLAGGLGADALNAARRDLDDRQRAASPRVERLYQALGSAPGQNWGEVLAAAESLLAMLPEHPAAKQARTRAWQQIGALNPTQQVIPGRSGGPAHLPNLLAAAPGVGPEASPGIVFLDDAEPRRGPARAMPAAVPPPAPAPAGPSGRFLLWADAVGGYLVCLDPEIVLGRAGADSQADVPLLGDLSRRHASLIRQGDGYVLRAHHPTFVNGRQVAAVAPLRDRDVIRLGSTVELLFRQPSPVSATARLEIVSRHRLPLAVEGVILMAETCILGPTAQAHVPAAHLEAPVVLYRQGASLWCRVPGQFEVDGKPCLSRAPLALKSNVLGQGFSFSLEPLGQRAATA
jgi:hypothetical protein